MSTDTTRRVVAMDLCDYCEGLGHDDDPLWPHPCPECDGKGLVPIARPCPNPWSLTMSVPETTERPWPANTPENRRDTGCYVVAKDPDDDEAGQCWCGAEIVGGYGQCAQCRYWMNGDET